MDHLIAFSCLWLVLNGLAIWLFDGMWRKAALVPAAIMGFAFAIATLGVLGGSNIAPIWVVFALPLCLVLIVLLWAARAVARVVAR